ncbi:MAG TPA: alpha-L-rhamnosidase C-terminal domain-containing protein, partial [Acidothermaceae bacterium]
PPARPDDARTDRYLVATAYHARTAQVLSDVAGVLGHNDDQRRYATRAAKVRVAFADEYVAPSGRISSDSQTAYALALAFDLLPTAAQRRHAGNRLAQLAAEEGYRIATGFVGTPLICDALTSVGAFDTAYHLLNQRECPSWLYPVTMGATTIWERWDSLLPDGTINPGGMTSFNHYALGAVADWLHRTVAGLAPAAPGYRRILVSPRPGGGLTNAAATLLTPFGAAAVEWTRVGRTFSLTVTVPPGTTASVHLPDPAVEPVDVGSGTHTFSCEFRDPVDDPPIPPKLNMHAQPIDEPVHVLGHAPLLDSQTA